MAEYRRAYAIGEIVNINSSGMSLWICESEAEMKDFFTIKFLCQDVEITVAVKSIIEHGTPHSSRKDKTDIDFVSKLVDLSENLRWQTVCFEGNLKEWQEKVKNPWEQKTADLLFSYFWAEKQLYVNDDLVFWMCETIARCDQ